MLWRHHKHWKRYCVTGIKLKGVAVVLFIRHVLWSLLWLCNHSITFMILLTGAFNWLECAVAVDEKYKLSDHVITVWDVSPCVSHFTWWRHQMETFFPRYCPFVRGIHRSPVNSPHKGQWRGALMFSLRCAWINGWVNNYEAGGLRRHRAHYDVTVITCKLFICSTMSRAMKVGHYGMTVISD